MDTAKAMFRTDIIIPSLRICEKAEMEAQEHWVDGLVKRYCERGIVRSVKACGEEIDRKERAAKALAPNAYRWDEIEAEGRGDHFHHGQYLGRKVMTLDDYTNYFVESHGKRALCCPATESALPIRELPKCDSMPVREDPAVCVPAEVKRDRENALTLAKEEKSFFSRIIELVKDWICYDSIKVSVANQRTRIPASLIASFLIIAFSLMMVVSGSVMVANANKEVGSLRREVDSLAREAELLEEKVEIKTDYLEIYRVATEELGMIDASKVTSVYLANDDDISIENIEEEEDVTFSLSTLLAAIGIHIGEK